MTQVKRLCRNFGQTRRALGSDRRAAQKSIPAGRTQLGTGDKFERLVPNAEPLLPRVNDDREILHRRLDQFLRPVARCGIEKQRVARFQKIGAVRVPVANLA